jgi:hypothetical protein
MSILLNLPVPVPSESVTLGQLITNPLQPSSNSLKPSSSSKPAQSANQKDADATSYITINEPSLAFETLCHESTTQEFLRKMVQQNKPVFFITGLQTSRAGSHKRAAVEHDPITEAATTPQPQLHLPFRRVDSASNMASPSSPTKSEPGVSVVAVQLLKVKCRVGAVNEPHCISDVDYTWSYHSLDEEEEDLQLSIGLGKPVEEREWRTLAGIAGKQEERNADHDWSYDYEESDNGLGGF